MASPTDAVQSTAAAPTTNTKMATVSYTANGKKGSFKVPVGMEICTAKQRHNAGLYFIHVNPNNDDRLITGDGEHPIYGHCRTIHQDTNIGKITPTQAKLFDFLRMHDGKPDLTPNDILTFAGLHHPEFEKFLIIK